jgi:hypothetical protein
MLTISPEKIAIPLQIIFIKSLRQCKYSSSWKNAHVAAIFKKGDTSLPSNYRPISLISCVSKSGRGTFSSSNSDIRLWYLFNKSHLSSSPLHNIVEVFIINRISKRRNTVASLI